MVSQTFYIIIFVNLLFFIESFGQTSQPTCSEQPSCSACINLGGNCAWCPASGCIDTSSTSCTASGKPGQLATSLDNCQCLQASSCKDIVDIESCGWCPSLNENLIYDAYGIKNDVTCTADYDLGQWSANGDDCNCLNIRSCDDMTSEGLFSSSHSYGWCPTKNRCYHYDAYGIEGGLECLNDIEHGQWSTVSDDCKCLTITACEDMTNSDLWSSQGTSRGFCPIHGRCLQYDAYGIKGENVTCVDDKDVGQWNTNDDDCKCLSINDCTQMMTTAQNLWDGHAWCPSLKHCYQYDAYGIKGGWDCHENYTIGQYTKNDGDCQCLTVSSCKEMSNSNLWDSDGSRGFCPVYGRCYKYDAYGINGGFSCPADTYIGQWTKSEYDCQCLSIRSCEEMTNGFLWDTDGQSRGFCPYYSRCYQYDSYGIQDGLNCPAHTYLGQWTRNAGDCDCLSVGSCEAMTTKLLWDSSGQSRGWCPYYGKCYKYDAYGIQDGLNCPADQQLGQWSRSEANCECLTSSNCVDAINVAQQGWCPSYKKCYQWNAYGLNGGLSCPTSSKGLKYTHHVDECNQNGGQCAKNCLSCDTTQPAMKCTECKEGYAGDYCQYNELLCNLCEKSSSKVMEAAMVAAGGEECFEGALSAVEGCGIIAAIPVVDVFACAGMGYAAYKFCDLVASTPAKLYCEANHMCEPKIISHLHDWRRRRLVDDINDTATVAIWGDNVTYPWWPPEFEMYGVQYIHYVLNDTNSTILSFHMSYSYVDNLMYSDLSNEALETSSYHISSNGSNYYIHRDKKYTHNNTCNFTTGDTELSASDYLDTHLRNLGIEGLTYNGTFVDSGISRWYAPICGNETYYDSLNGTNSTYYDSSPQECNIAYYYFDTQETSQSQTYRKPLQSKMIVGNGDIEIVTAFYGFATNISDYSVFQAEPVNCLPTVAPTASPSGTPSTAPSKQSTPPSRSPLADLETHPPTIISSSTSTMNLMTTDITATQPDDKNNEKSNTHGVSGGVVAVIVIMLVLIVVAVFFGIYWWKKRKKQQISRTIGANLNYQLMDDQAVDTAL